MACRFSFVLVWPWQVKVLMCSVSFVATKLRRRACHACDCYHTPHSFCRHSGNSRKTSDQPAGCRRCYGIGQSADVKRYGARPIGHWVKPRSTNVVVYFVLTPRLLDGATAALGTVSRCIPYVSQHKPGCSAGGIRGPLLHSGVAPHQRGNATTWSMSRRMPILSPSAWLWWLGTRDNTRAPPSSPRV